MFNSFEGPPTFESTPQPQQGPEPEKPQSAAREALEEDISRRVEARREKAEREAREARVSEQPGAQQGEKVERRSLTPEQIREIQTLIKSEVVDLRNQVLEKTKAVPGYSPLQRDRARNDLMSRLKKASDLANGILPRNPNFIVNTKQAIGFVNSVRESLEHPPLALEISASQIKWQGDKGQDEKAQI